MSDLERSLRAAFALDAGATPGPGFEARMARAARTRRRGRAVPLALAAAVAGAAIATLLLTPGRDRPARVALRPPPPAAAPARPASGRSSITEVWEVVVRVTRSWTADRAASDEPPGPRPSRRRPVRRHRSAAPDIDCGNDPLCPLIAPNAARLSVATAGGPARVYIDGQDAGSAPLVIDVIPGRHRVTVRFERGGTRSAGVVLAPGERRTLHLQPGPDPRPR